MSTLTFVQLLIFDKAKIHIFAESLDVSCYFNLLLSIYWTYTIFIYLEMDKACNLCFYEFIFR